MHPDNAFIGDSFPTTRNEVYSRFIGSDHSRQNSLTVKVLTDFLRAFVDVEVETHSVASPMTEIPLGVP